MARDKDNKARTITVKLRNKQRGVRDRNDQRDRERRGTWSRKRDNNNITRMDREGDGAGREEERRKGER